MPDTKIKDCVCDECAKGMGYVPKDKIVGVWTGECEFCGESKPLTSLSHDWIKLNKHAGAARQPTERWVW